VAKLIRVIPGFWIDPDEVRYLLIGSEEGKQWVYIRWKSQDTEDVTRLPILSDDGLSLIDSLADLINGVSEADHDRPET
jgi:hypothetical protein